MTIESPARLVARDRCDRCGARAYVRAVFERGELLFCAHHGREAMPRLRATAHRIDDFSDDLQPADLLS
ncbi:MAG: hypothetical protein LBE08_00195 [Bifidobacteriaceae bacterium]|nr:hypothetical protein [Bifidobacteriaceae bacterium]